MDLHACRAQTVKSNAFSTQMQNKDIYATTAMLMFHINKCSWDLLPLLLHVYRLFYANQHE